MSTYSEIIEEQQFHDRVKHATREILACIENGEIQSVVEALNNHPFPKSIKFDELVARAVAQKDTTIFDAVMDFIAQKSLKVSYNRHVRQSMICACENDFLHALNCNTQWNSQHITSSFYLHLLQKSTQHNSSDCLQFTLSSPHTLNTPQWMNLVGEALTHICPDTLNILLDMSTKNDQKDRLWLLSFLAAEHLKPLQPVMFDHFSLQNILIYTPQHRLDEVTDSYNAHIALRAEEQKNRIGHELVSHHRLKERKL